MSDDAAVPRPTLAALLVGLEAEVKRGPYLITGAVLMVLKYGLDCALVYLVTRHFWSPLAYLNPVLTLRERDLGTAPSWLFLVLAVMTLPFLWIGVSMSVRRAADAGFPAFVGLAFFLPGINYLLMLALAAFPTRTRDGVPLSLRSRRGPARADVGDGVKSALYGVVAGVGLAAGMGGLSIYALGLYGAALFFGTPVAMGATSAYIYNRRQLRSLPMTLLVGQVSVALSGLGVLLFALEGALCLAMAFPIASVLGLLGSAVGYGLARSIDTTAAPGVALLLLLPAGAVTENATQRTPLYQVTTTVEIDAPPERVFPHVVGFSELPPPTEWYYRAGIAYPMRARIDGMGVGATRRCEFSTGAFVEPITTWDAPHRLAFDVAEHPAPMQEWSPYRHITPPHLEGYIRSRRGEFRLVELPGGRTRVEGTTWYELRMAPAAYWTLWSDELLHSIHGRVLGHIKLLSETPAAPPGG